MPSDPTSADPPVDAATDPAVVAAAYPPAAAAADRSIASGAAAGHSSRDPLPLCDMAYGYLKAGDRKRALDAALRAAAMTPRGGAALGCLAQVHLARRELDEAQATVDRGLQANGRDPNLHVIAARVAEARGDELAAVAAVSRALSHSSRHAPARAELQRVAPLKVSPLVVAQSASTLARAAERYPQQPEIIRHLDSALRFALIRLAALTVAGALISSIVLARGTDRQAGFGCWALVVLLCIDSGAFLYKAAKPTLARLRAQCIGSRADGDGELRRPFVLQVLALCSLLTTPALPGKWQAIAAALAGLFAGLALAELVETSRRQTARRPLPVSGAAFQWTVMVLVATLAIAAVIATKAPIAGGLWIVVVGVWMVLIVRDRRESMRL